MRETKECMPMRPRKKTFGNVCGVFVQAANDSGHPPPPHQKKNLAWHVWGGPAMWAPCFFV